MNKPYESYNIDEVGAKQVNELTDVKLTNLANGELLVYDSSTNKWLNQSAGGIDSVTSLTDTTITNLSDNEILRYDSASSKWVNESLPTDADTDNINDLTDTNITNLADKDFLLYDNTSSKWINTPSIIDNLKNVTITSLANGEILKYNSTSSKWENSLVLINEIGDVNITSLQNGEVLKYNSTSSKWENQNNTDTLDELSDVTITSIQNNNILKYNSTSSKFVNTFINLTELADTNITSLNNGNILRYNSTAQKWEPNSFNINDLDDVNITSIANNEVLKYNSTSGKWENSNRIDTLDELGDVTLSNVASNDLLRFNGSIFVNTKIPFDNDFTNVNFTNLTNGDLIKYNGSNFINFAPTYLDGAGISNNFLIKVVSGVSTQTSITETNTANSTNISFNNGSIETEIFDTTKKRMHLTTDGIASTNGITITSDGRVGIGTVEPEEDLEIDGSIQIDSANVARLKFQKSGQTPHALAEIDGEEDGTNGGDLQFYTKVDGSSVTEKLRINNVGAIGIGGATYGTTNQVLVSNGSGSSVSWANQTDTTYSAGTGVSINGSNQISIGQSVGTSDSPSFTQLSLGVSGINQGIINLQDFTNTGTETIAQIKGILDGTNGGALAFYTKEDGGSLTQKMKIFENGTVTITGTVVLPSATSIGNVSSTEIGYVNGVTSSIQTQLNTKAPTASPTFTGAAAFASLSSTANGVFNNCRIGDMGYGNTYAGIAHNSLSQPGNYALLSKNDGTTLLNASSGKPITFRIGNFQKMMLNSFGELLVSNNVFAKGKIFPMAGTGELRHYVHSTYATLYMGVYAENIGFYGDVGINGYIEDDANVGRIDFTGQHRAFVEDITYKNAGTYEGLIVCANKNDYITLAENLVRGRDAILQNESLPLVSLCKKEKDKTCFGVISSSEDPEMRVDKFGCFASVGRKQKGDTRIYINSVGEGAMWVCNASGSLESGDYITTSNVAGYGKKQEDDILHNYTVAKITMDCDFNPAIQPKQILLTKDGENVLDSNGLLQWTNEVGVFEEKYKIRYVDVDGNIISKDAYDINKEECFICAYVGVTYHCG